MLISDLAPRERGFLFCWKAASVLCYRHFSFNAGTATHATRTKADPMNPIELRNFITTTFNDNELRDLCFDLKIPYEDLGGEGRSAKARELVAYCQRRDRLAELEATCLRLRSDVSNSPVPSAPADQPSSSSIVTQSGGVAIHAETVNVYGDMIGRDKTAMGSAGSAGSESTPPAPPPPSPDLKVTPTTSDQFAYDVFISYRTKERDWVRRELLPQLEKYGLKVCIDYRDFRPGQPVVDELERAVTTSRKTLLILTAEYSASGWTALENQMLQAFDAEQQQHRLIPLIKERCELPLRIRYITYVNFIDPDDWNIAWTQLLTALGAVQTEKLSELPTPTEWSLAHPYGMPPNFTGRMLERTMLKRWLNTDYDHPLLVLHALGGFGKSALTWYWLLHDVDPVHWPHVVWWSFYDADASFEQFLQHALAYLGSDPHTFGVRQQAMMLVRRLSYPGVLLVLDGFERVLRAFSSMNAAYQGDSFLLEPEVEKRKSKPDNERECVSPTAENFLLGIASMPGIRSKVLMTTRLIPGILQVRGGQLLQGCVEKELLQMQPVDAVTFFRAQSVRGSRAEIENACSPYGYHPLSLRLLAGLIIGDLRQPGDIAVAKRLNVSNDLIHNQHHVLEHAYNSLTPARQKLLSRIACFRSAVSYEALHTLAFDSPSPENQERRPGGEVFDADLQDLLARGLLHRDKKTNRFDLHPIVRRYAYDRLTAGDRTAAHTQLRDYFAAVPTSDKVQTLDDLQPVIELYHHTVCAGQYDEAAVLFRDRISQATYYQFGAYQLRIELLRALFSDGEDRPPRLKDEDARGWTLTALANSYSLSGQPHRAVPLLEQDIAICEKAGDKQNLAIGLGNVADDQLKIGALRAAEANLRRSIDLGREIAYEYAEAVGHQELGRLLAYRGLWAESEQELATALAMFEKQQHVQMQGVTLAYRALCTLLLARQFPSPEVGRGVRGEALTAAHRAREPADETARTRYPHPRDYVRDHWLLGAAYRLNGDLTQAEQHLSEALSRCRNINSVDAEADILLDLARLRADQNEREEALRLAQEALLITERSGYVMQGADMHLFLAQVALKDNDKKQALQHAREARRLATCDGPPDYTYKVAYDEAGALLKELGEN